MKNQEEFLKEKGKLPNNDLSVKDGNRSNNDLNCFTDHKMQAEQTQQMQINIQNQTNRFIGFFENAPVAFLSITRSGNIVDLNRKTREIFEISEQNLSNISIFPFINDDSKTGFIAMLEKAFSDQQEQTGEYRLITENKAFDFAEIHLTKYYDQEEQEDLCQVTITSNENAREAFKTKLRESEKKYRELAENISEGIYLTENEYLKMVNTPACKLFGFTMEEMIGMRVWDFVQSGQKEEIRKFILKKIAEQDSSPVDLQCVRKDGSIFWAEISMRIIKDKNRVFGVISDISARKKTEEDLRRSEQRLHMALKGTKAGLWDWDITSGDAIFDDWWAKILGFNNHEIEPEISSWKKLIHPDDYNKVEEKLKQHFEGKTEFFQSIHRLKAKDGIWRYVFSSGMVIERNEGGEPLRAVGTFQDITRQKQIEEKLIKINATKDKLFSIIAHDLKSPYNAQLGFLELLIEDEDSYSPEQRKKFIKTVYQSTKQSFSLLDNLLMWSRTQTGKIPFNPSKLHLAQVFEEAIDLQQYAAAGKNIMISTDIANDDLQVNADYEMVNTILRNLISNAIKFTPENGEIIIGAKAAANNKALIYIRDNGVGIPEKDMDLLFDAGNNYTTIGTNKEKGTGIGLIICKDFVERNGGIIWAESDPDGSRGSKGSTFYFTLDNTNKIKTCKSNCIQNLKRVNTQIKQNQELHNYFLRTIIPFFRHTYQKFSNEEINCFVDEMKRLSEKHHIEEFKTFSIMIADSLISNDKNQINICFAEFERLTDQLEIVASKGEYQK
ncbi:MAG: PAS domain S-box protein [Bacteroidales bacterium]|nr:PAS domain S-box protein [Bacteroidales bacterium]